MLTSTWGNGREVRSLGEGERRVVAGPLKLPASPAAVRISINCMIVADVEVEGRGPQRRHWSVLQNSVGVPLSRHLMGHK